MEHHEALNKLKDTEGALFRECEKVVKLEQALAEKDTELTEHKKALVMQVEETTRLRREIERLREVHADEKVAWKAKHNAEMTVIEQQCERYRVELIEALKWKADMIEYHQGAQYVIELRKRIEALKEKNDDHDRESQPIADRLE